MDRKFQKLYICTLAVVFVLGISVAYAQPADDVGYSRKKGNREEMANKFQEEIGLTDDQHEELKKRRAEYRKVVKELRQQLKEKRKELKEELNKSPADEGKISSLVSEIKAVSGKLLDTRVAHILATKKILTPEQAEKLKNMEKKHKKRGKKKGNYSDTKDMKRKHHRGQTEENTDADMVW